MSKNLFVTGTATDVGKTYITALMVKKLADAGIKCAYFKAAASGNPRNSRGEIIPLDPLSVKNTAEVSNPVEICCPYVYETAASPCLAAEIEGNPVDLNVVSEKFGRLTERCDAVTAEGSGGILCPMSRKDGTIVWLEDVIKKLNLSCLIVADAGLGAINSVGLTVSYLNARGITIKGVIFNRYDPENAVCRDNVKTCREAFGIKVVATVENGADDLGISAEELFSLYD